MKFYYIIILLTAILQPFSCVGMDRYPEEFIIMPVLVVTESEESFTKEDLIVFPTPIPAEINEYFPDSGVKLTFPDKAKQKLIAMCKSQNDLHKKEVFQREQQKIVELIELQRAQQQILAIIEKDNADLKQKCIEFRNKTKTIQKEIQEKKAYLDHKTTEPRNLQQITLQKKHQKQNRSGASDLPPIQALMKKFGATNIACLKYCLGKECTDIQNGKKINNVLKGSYYDKKNKLLYVSINDKSSCTFCPQSNKLQIVKRPFSTLDIDTDSSSNSSCSCADSDNTSSDKE